ncbi:methyltransferase and TPR repeat domain containing protein [Nitzschia inconspicua]|uniref:Methyltransferase and TPR repeat domain containing protein n=1 Tax=Nitzschia inconspicua TaxID=303405 RepID=A0A9K3P8R3_9STRA|nr:methyltransferase and TPR repeat domain containing protein [Nitzschia inconspicua]KAG7364099.1 methyltransferase and TPR repeat domain containing protein [Nitzschia inconspicua]
MSVLLLVLANAQPRDDSNLSPEELFRQTLNEWMKSMEGPDISWYVWTDFATTLVNEYQEASKMSSSSASVIQKRHLEIVGAIEEGILTIERFLAHQVQPNMKAVRTDAVLAELYASYGVLLEQLTAIECWKLASDPHTLLIGAPERMVQYQAKLQNDDNEMKLLQEIFPPLCLDNADNAVRNAMSLDATNMEALKLLEKLTGNNDPTVVHQRKPQEFMAELFDSFADTFDEKLVGTLQYRVPQLIGEAVRKSIVEKAASDGFTAVLDAGCGTGLAGRYLRPMIKEVRPPGIMVGVDASPKMLDIAANCTRTFGCGLQASTAHGNNESDLQQSNRRPLYDRLLQMDLEDMTLANTLNGFSQKNFDLIVAADVLVYFGSLEKILKVFASLCNDSDPSWLIFSCERALPEETPLGFRLLPSGRFAHTKKHVLDMADNAGFTLIEYSEIVPRMEKGEPVQGHLFVFELSKRQGKMEGKEL